MVARRSQKVDELVRETVRILATAEPAYIDRKVAGLLREQGNHSYRALLVTALREARLWPPDVRIGRRDD